MSKKTIFIIVFLLTIIGGLLRFWGFTKNPPQLNIDEVSFGYNAYSILKTGRDEYGKFLPLTFKSTGDYKNPVPVYLLVPSIAVFGLNEFAVRFPTTLIATISIPFFFLFFLKLTKKSSVALAATALLTFSPWHIYYSRYLYEPLLAIFFVSVGVYLFMKMLEGSRLSIFFSAFFFILSIYTSFSDRLFVPFLILTLLWLYREKIKNKKRAIIFFLATTAIMAIPLLYRTFFGPDSTRAGMVFLTKDIDYTRYVLLNEVKFVSGFWATLTKPFLLLFFWIKRFLNYIQPSFLFFTGLNMTTLGSYGLGIANLFELPFLIFGLIELIKNKIPYKWLIILWFILGIFPASLTNNEQSPGRTLLILPPLILLSGYGAIAFFQWISKFKNKILHFASTGIFIVFIFWCLFRAYLVFSVHFPKERDEAFMNGTKEALLYAIANQDKYKEIVFDPYRGIEAPYIVSIPDIYYLFYSKYDPAKYQSLTKTYGDEYYHFDKFTVRRTEWRADRSKKDVLFIGSPWSFPKGDLKDTLILKNIYLNNGALALMVVTHK